MDALIRVGVSRHHVRISVARCGRKRNREARRAGGVSRKFDSMQDPYDIWLDKVSLTAQLGVCTYLRIPCWDF